MCDSLIKILPTFVIEILNYQIMKRFICYFAFFCAISFFFSCSSSDSDEELTETEEEVDPLDATGTINGYDYVDLGLSVKWARCNLGASSIGDSGDFYSWGETETKDYYFTSTYSSIEMDEISGDETYDAARANMGGKWRMPTSAEMSELISSCDWEWTIEDHTNGYLVTGSNGNAIFLPAAGYYWTDSWLGVKEDGRYLSSTRYVSDYSDTCAYYLYFDEDYKRLTGFGFMYNGFTIRAVCD